MSKVCLKELLEVAEGEIGYVEKATNSNLDNPTANAGNKNFTKYARDLYNAGYYNGNKNGYAWCDVFVDWCFYIAAGKDAAYAQKVECQTGDCGAGCSFSAQYYAAQGRFYKKPKVGDQIFFGSASNVYHTGIVVDVTETKVFTIEGNTSDKVKRNAYAIGDGSIYGYGRPKYDTEPAVEPTPAPAPTPAPVEKTEEGFKEFLKSLNDNDASNWSAAARAWAVSNGIIAGIGTLPDGTPNYAWEAFMTREQYITMRYREYMRFGH